MAIDLKPEHQREIDLTAHIEQGFAQAERAELIGGDAAIAMLRQRRAARLKLQGIVISNREE